MARISKLFFNSLLRDSSAGFIGGHMELYFICPVKEQGFWSADWRNKGELKVIQDEKGRRLEGLIEVFCPLCGGTHQFTPDQTACPLTAP